MIKVLKESRGITLIALVITIIVLLILAGVAISMLSGENGILNKATNAKQKTEEESVREAIRLAEISARMLNDGSLNKEDLENELKSYFGENGFTIEEIQDEEGTQTGFKVIVGKVEENIEEKGVKNIELTEGQVIINGEKVTPDNVAGYLGKVVLNYKGKENVLIDSTECKVSPKYRLYYIDFDGKYGDKGAIYLKAECTANSTKLPIVETTPDNPNKTDKIKIRALNPGLYENEEGESKTPPIASYNNMKAITWLTDSTKWSGLKPDTYFEGITVNDINYIVGAPSLEMMMDSYNTHYNLSGETPQTGTLDRTPEGIRTKLFYQYNQGDYGYKVGPADSNAWGTVSSYYSVKADSKIDTMYCPEDKQYYWLASPSAGSSDFVMNVSYRNGGCVENSSYSSYIALCPLVSLKNSVQLKLE